MTRGRASFACLVGLVAYGAAGCSDSSFEYEGVAGRPIPAVLETWVPGVPISVEGGAANTFLVDTGAPLTMLDRDDYTDLEDGKHALTLEAFELSFPELDVAMVPIGSYRPAWFMEHNHMNPEQAGRAFLDVGANEVVQLLTSVTLISATFFIIAPSVAWLAGADDLIAPSPVSQEVARLRSVTPETRRRWLWLTVAALPGACIGLGLMVWFARRF